MLALIANVNRDPKKRRRPYRPDEFNPYTAGAREPLGIRITAGNIQALRKLI